MKKFHVNLFTLLLICALVGLGSTALANPGSGYGPHWRAMGNSPCYGYGQGRGFRPRDGFWNLSEEDQKKLDQERKAFWDATNDLRQEMRKTGFELMAALSGKNIDAQKAISLQKKISDLRAQLDKKRLEHMLKVKEMFPNLEIPFGPFSHKGRGFGRGPGYGGCR